MKGSKPTIIVGVDLLHVACELPRQDGAGVATMLLLHAACVGVDLLHIACVLRLDGAEVATFINL